jgi:hypothetical protein
MSIHREVTLTLLSFELRWVQAEPAAGGQCAIKRKPVQGGRKGNTAAASLPAGVRCGDHRTARLRPARARRKHLADTSPTYHRHTQSVDRIDQVDQAESGIAVSRGSFVSTAQSLIGHLTY